MLKAQQVQLAMERQPDQVLVFLDVDCRVLAPLDELADIGGDVAFYVRSKFRRSGGMRFDVRSGTLVLQPTLAAARFVDEWVKLSDLGEGQTWVPAGAAFLGTRSRPPVCARGESCGGYLRWCPDDKRNLDLLGRRRLVSLPQVWSRSSFRARPFQATPTGRGMLRGRRGRHSLSSNSRKTASLMAIIEQCPSNEFFRDRSTAY
jgi:hypothetical protein